MGCLPAGQPCTWTAYGKSVSLLWHLNIEAWRSVHCALRFLVSHFCLQLHIIKLWCPYVLWKYIFCGAIRLCSLCSLCKLIWQNLFNLMYDNPEILIIQYLRRVVPSPEVLLFSRKKLHQFNRQISGHVQKGLPRARSFSSVMLHSIDW